MYLIIFLLNVFDLALTHVAVNILGYVELNPLMAPIVSSWWIVPVKLIGAFLVAYGLWRCRKIKAGRVVAWGVLLMYLLVVLDNGITLLR